MAARAKNRRTFKQHLLGQWPDFKIISQKCSMDDHPQVGAIQMGTHNMCLYKKVDKKYTGCNLKTTELVDCALTGVCVVIRSNMV